MHSNSGLIIRPSTPLDNEEIAKLSVIAWQESYQWAFPADLLSNLSWSQRAEGRKKYFISDPQKAGVVAEVEHRLAGFCDFGLARKVPHISAVDETYAELYAVYVLDKYKSQGIGKKLVSAAYEYLSNQPYENLIVWTLVDNIAAINFYKSVGLNTTEWRKQTEVGGKFYEEIALLKSLR